MWKRVVLIGSILIFLSGCSVQKNETEKLKDLDPVAYVRFASVYREFKDVNTFMDELKKFLQ